MAILVNFCRLAAILVVQYNIGSGNIGGILQVATDRIGAVLYTVPKAIDFPRYNMKCRWENVILRGIFHVVSRFPLHFMLYRGTLDYFLLLDSVSQLD